MVTAGNTRENVGESTQGQQSRALHIGLWVAQALLAIAFGMAGLMKLITPYAELAANMAWVADAPEALIRFIGLAEVAGAIGVVLPAATRIKPGLTPLAAAGFVVIMILAAGLHLWLGEPPVVNFVLGALAGFVVWGRWKRAPIRPRN